jgi:hypothetical protein
MPHPGGRRSKKTEQTVNALLKAIATGAPYVICCKAVGIHFDTFMGWRQTDPGFAVKVEQTAAKAALRLLGKIEAQATNNFAACSWILERRFPELFSRPEVQLNLQTNVVQNNLTITIAPQEARAIEAEALPVRERVRELFANYRPALSTGGNGEGKRTVEVEVDAVKAEELAPIVRKEGEENSPVFWARFAGGTGERRVDKATAIFAVKVIVDEVCGAGRGNQALVAFKTEPIDVADVISVIERLCGGPAGWQHLQKKAGLAS